MYPNQWPAEGYPSHSIERSAPVQLDFHSELIGAVKLPILRVRSRCKTSCKNYFSNPSHNATESALKYRIENQIHELLSFGKSFCLSSSSGKSTSAQVLRTYPSIQSRKDGFRLFPSGFRKKKNVSMLFSLTCIAELGNVGGENWILLQRLDLMYMIQSASWTLDTKEKIIWFCSPGSELFSYAYDDKNLRHII